MLTLALITAMSAQARQPIIVDGVLCHPNRLLVKAKSPGTLRSIEQRGGVILRNMPEIGWAVVEVGAEKLKPGRQMLRSIPGVEAVEYDRAAQIAYTPNDPLYGSQWGIPALRVNYAWDLSLGRKPVTVAVLDTGVEVGHQDLAPNVWVNTDEIPGNFLDDDKNGFIDDVNGWDFVNGDNDPADDHGHGTLCSGAIAAVQNNSIGVSGVAPQARIMAMKVANSSGYFFDSDTAPAYLYAAKNGARVFSCSFFSDRVSAVERDALEFAKRKGVLPIVAAGNSNSVIPYYPASHEVSMAVAALDPSLHRAGFSNYGSHIDIAAPGVSIQTIARFNGYGSFSGTSLACPMAAGVAALLLSVRPNAGPTLIRRVMEDTATSLVEAPMGEFTNYGLLNAEAAMTAMLSTLPPPRPAAFRYMTMAGSRKPGRPEWRTRIWGRGFQPPVNVVLKADGNPVPLKRQTRDYIDFKTPSGTNTLELFADDALVATIKQPSTKQYVYPLTEASTQGATVTGGFFETLNEDTSSMTCSRRADGTIYLETVFREVRKDPTMTLRIRRVLEPATPATEMIEVYDWSTASYPYGSWVTVSSGAAPSIMTTNNIALPGDARRFRDVDGHMYFRIRTTNGLPSEAVYKIDQMHIK